MSFYVFVTKYSNEPSKWQIPCPLFEHSMLLLKRWHCFIQRNNFTSVRRNYQIGALDTAESSWQHTAIIKQPCEEWNPTFVVNGLSPLRWATCALLSSCLFPHWPRLSPVQEHVFKLNTPLWNQGTKLLNYNANPSTPQHTHSLLTWN